MYAQNANFCLNTLSIIIGSSIEYYSICSKKYENPRVEGINYVDEILFVCPDSLVFIGNKIRNGIKRKILFENVKSIELNSEDTNKIVIQLLNPIKKKNKMSYEFQVQSRDIFLECLSGKYKIYHLKKTGKIKPLTINVEYALNAVFSNLLLNTKNKKNEEATMYDGTKYVPKYISNYRFDLYFEFENDPNDPFLFHKKKKNSEMKLESKDNSEAEEKDVEIIENEDEDDKDMEGLIKRIPERDATLKIIIPKEQPIELLNSNSNELHLNFFAEFSFKKYLDTFPYGENNDYWIISQSRVKKNKIKEDLSKWKAWRFEIRTKPKNKIGLNIIYYYVRRLYIPPFFESYNDFIFIIEEKYYDEFNHIEFTNEIKATIETIFETFSPVKFQQRNEISDEIILSKMEGYLIDSKTLNYLYQDIGITGKESYKFNLDYKMKLALLYEDYEKSSLAKDYMETIKNAYQRIDEEELNEENYKKNLRHISFDALLAKQVRFIKNSFDIVDPVAIKIWESKIRNYLGFIADGKNSPKLCEKIFDLNKRVPDFSKAINPVLNQFLNLQVITTKKQIILDVSINYIVSHLPEIEEIAFNEKYMKTFIINGKLKEIQQIESDLIFFEFLNIIINRNFSYQILSAVHDYFNKIKRNSVSQNVDETDFSSEALSLKKYADIFIASFKKLYFDHRQSSNILVLCCKCLIILLSLDKQNISLIMSEDCSISLYRYFSSSNQSLLFESIMLFSIITQSKCDLREILSTNPKFLYKLINIIKGTNIPNCYYHPEIIQLVLNFFAEMLSLNLIKELLYESKARKFVKYIMRYIAEPEIYLKNHIDYYFVITTVTYRLLSVIVLKNSEMRKYIENNYHLIKLINTKFEDYMLYLKMISEIPKTKRLIIISMFIEIIDFLISYLGKDRSMKNLIKFYGKNILLLAKIVNENPSEYFDIGDFIELIEN